MKWSIRQLLVPLILVGCQASGTQPAPAGSAAPTPTSATAPTPTSATAPTPTSATAVEVTPAWPSIPRSEAAATALIAERATRPLKTPKTWTAADVADTLLAQARVGKVQIARRAIADALSARLSGSRAIVAFGTFHDSGAQVALFRQLVGSPGMMNVSTVVLEQFQSTGKWRGDTNEPGDEVLLNRFLATGTAEDKRALHKLQRQRNYTAWKYGYVHEMLDLLLTARGSNQRVIGCDMPSAMQRRLRPSLGPKLVALRDVHCVSILQGPLDNLLAGKQEGGIIALLYGQAHVRANGLSRYLPRPLTLLPVLMFGGRHGTAGVAPQLGKRLRLTAPTMAQASDGEMLLVLPDEHTMGIVDRVRDPSAAAGLEVTSPTEATITINGQRYPLEATTQQLPAASEIGTYLYQPPTGAVWLGRINGDTAALDFDPEGNRVGVVQRH